MENISIINEQQLREIVYDAVKTCVDECLAPILNNKVDDDGYYSREELCDILHIAYPTLWRLEKRGMLKCSKIGRRNLYKKSEVNELIKSGKLAKYKKIE